MSKFKQYKQLSLSNIHKEVLGNWKESDVFDKSIERRKGNPTFTFYEGPSPITKPSLSLSNGRGLRIIKASIIPYNILK